MTAYAVMIIDSHPFKKDKAYEITDRDGGSYELGGDDEWVDRDDFLHIPGSDAKRIIAEYFTQHH